MSSQETDASSSLTQKTREEIKAEREVKKTAKAAAKATKSRPSKANVADNQSTANKVTPVASSNEIPVARIAFIKADRTPEKSDDARLGSPGTTGNKLLEQIVKPDPTDVTKDKRVTREVPEPVAAAPSDIAATDWPSEGNDGQRKAELRAERRAKQEAQRASKQQQQSVAKSNVKPEAIKQTAKPAGTVSTVSAVKRIVARSVAKEDAHEINLFKHLHRKHDLSSMRIATVNSRIHPAIVKLGAQYASKVIVGSNARCVALLAAVKQVVGDFEKPAQADFVRGLEATLQESLGYVHYCRPLAVSMQNAMRHLKWQMTQFPSTLSDDEARSKLQSVIDTYIKEQIELADQAISLTIQSKISNGNVILTYGYSSLIYKILVDAHAAGKQFRVIVVDGRPWLEGKELLRRLVKHGLECSYILINALSFVMPEVNKVFLGAHAIFANGAVMSRAGTAQVALIARAFNVPVLVACETHKSCERVQTDSIVYNELGDADELVNHHGSNCGSSKKSALSNWRTRKSLNLLNIMYDVTPADLVTAVVTELAIMPCTSVPVILRIKPSEI